MLLPNFTNGQRGQLRACGVCGEQVAELRKTLTTIRRTLFKPAARNDVKAVLVEVAELSESLMRVLADTAMPTEAAHGEALSRIEERYWTERPDDDGPTSMHHLIPRLYALAEAARDGVGDLPDNPTRHRTANPQPIRRIDEALTRGWHLAHPPGKLLPENLRPSESKGNFREVAGICYEATGAPTDTDPTGAQRLAGGFLIQSKTRLLANAFPEPGKIIINQAIQKSS